MARTVNTITNSNKMVDLVCTNTDKIIQVKMISFEKNKLVIEMPTGQRLTMLPYPNNPTMYIVNMSGLELTCIPGNPKI